MMIMRYILCFLILFTIAINKGNSNDSSAVELYNRAFDEILKNSGFINYFGIPTNVKTQNSTEEVVFEANIGPNFLIYNNQNKRLDFFKRLKISLQAQITLRTYEIRLRPVFPPNYTVALIPEYLLVVTSANILSLSVDMRHLSNGQAGDFYKDTSQTELNYRDATFSTYCFTYKLSWLHFFNKNVSDNGSSRFRQSYYYRNDNHFDETYPFTKRPMHNSYGAHRIGADFQYTSKIFRLNRSISDVMDCKNLKCTRFTLRVENAYIMGDLSNYQNSEGDFRYSLKARAIIDFPGWIPLNLFVQYYSGRDYYNIRYTEKINMLMFGICF